MFRKFVAKEILFFFSFSKRFQHKAITSHVQWRYTIILREKKKTQMKEILNERNIFTFAIKGFLMIINLLQCLKHMFINGSSQERKLCWCSLDRCFLLQKKSLQCKIALLKSTSSIQIEVAFNKYCCHPFRDDIIQWLVQWCQSTDANNLEFFKNYVDESFATKRSLIMNARQ